MARKPNPSKPASTPPPQAIGGHIYPASVGIELPPPEVHAEAEALSPARAAELADMLTALRKAAGHPDHAAGPLAADERAAWGAADDLAQAAHDLPPALREAVRAVVRKYMERAERKREDLDAVQWVQEAGLERALRARAAEPEEARERAGTDGAEESALRLADLEAACRALMREDCAMREGIERALILAVGSGEPDLDALRNLGSSLGLLGPEAAASEARWPTSWRPVLDSLRDLWRIVDKEDLDAARLSVELLSRESYERGRKVRLYRMAEQGQALLDALRAALRDSREPEEALLPSRDGQVAEPRRIVTNNFTIEKVGTLAVQTDSPGATQTVTRQSEPARSSWWKWIPAWLVAVLKLLGLEKLLGLTS